jgi:2-haloacid dehalogenase
MRNPSSTAPWRIDRRPPLCDLIGAEAWIAPMNIVFDIGDVLIAWRPERAFAGHFPDEATARAWLDSIDFFDWNYAFDGGRGFREGLAAAEAAHPGRTGPLAAYLAGFPDAIRAPIAGTWEVLDRLQGRGYPLYAITNFAAETWPLALGVHPRLGTVFRDIVVSGHERLLKPQPQIYERLLTRNGLAAGDCLFIDDNPKNVEGARAVGMQAHHFTSPADLEAELSRRGLL